LRRLEATAKGVKEDRMAKARVFTGFDFDHDEDLRNLLVGQARLPDSPFELADWSVKGKSSRFPVVRAAAVATTADVRWPACAGG
jgi:hypothetical protein